ncbi:MAG TPA: LamG-like jellyroll fold domain-containing protein [Aquihabitans sp.]|jgi:hypothetical protein|nr:LamG-like jellyroll fold domain-containing protein [Aquihabitans sp.]
MRGGVRWAVLAVAVVALAGCEQSMRFGDITPPGGAPGPGRFGIVEATMGGAGPLVGAGDLTVELWVKTPAGSAEPMPCSSAGEGLVQSAMTEYPGIYYRTNRWGLGLAADGDVFFGAAPERVPATTDAYEIPHPVCTDLAGAGVRDGAWHHLAVVRTVAGEVTIFVDGTLATTGTSGAGALNQPGVFATPHTRFRVAGQAAVSSRDPFFTGQIDELRISTGRRYVTPFTPATDPFTADAATTGLWHFDEVVRSPQNSRYVPEASGKGPSLVATTVYLDSGDPLVGDSPFID